jgi:hypothetical protein
VKSTAQRVLSKCSVERTGSYVKLIDLTRFGVLRAGPLLAATERNSLPPTRRMRERPGWIMNPKTHMAWRPYENLIDGELDNRTPGKVTGWMRFCRSGKRPLKVHFDLAGDFHEDIRGTVIRVSNSHPTDRNSDLERVGTYMDGFASMQRGETGDITAGLSLGPWTGDLSQQLLAQHELSWENAGVPANERERRRQELADSFRERIERNELFYPYVDYPYIEWYSEANGRVVLELDPKQVEILDGGAQPREKTTKELVDDQSRRQTALIGFLRNMAAELSGVSRRRDAESSTSEQTNE